MLNRTWIRTLAAVLALAAPASAEPPPRQVNVTADSAPGWLPSEALERAARKTAADFLAAKDGGRYDEAYGFLSDLSREQQPFEAYSAQMRRFNADAGAVLERRFTLITWTKDPAQAPAPGVYAAIDLVSRFAGIDRHCGYLVLWQAPAGGDFRVMREESNYLDNATAREIGSEAEVEAAWSRLSANCPNYRPEPLAESPGSSIGYPTAAAALEALRAKPGVAIATQDGWTVASDEPEMTLWSFPPPGHPAYPAAVKRRTFLQDGQTMLVMTVHCEASKTACDDLVRTFQQMNAALTASLQGKR